MRTILTPTYATSVHDANPSALNLYVDSNNGSDSNNGLATDTPLATLQAALDKIPAVYTRNYTIHVASGTHSDADAALIGRKPAGNHHIRIQGYLHGTAGQWAHEAVVTGTATSAAGVTDSGSDMVEAYLADTAATLTSVTAGMFLHLTGGTGYDADHDEQNWYVIYTVSGSQINIVGEWSNGTPSTDTTYEVLDGSLCKFDHDAATPILTLAQSDNVSVRCIEFYGGQSRPSVLLLDAHSFYPGAWRWTDIIGITPPTSIDPYRDMWLGVQLTGSRNDNRGIQLVHSDLVLRCAYGNGTPRNVSGWAHSPVHTAYGSACTLVSVYFEKFRHNIYSGLHARMMVSGAYLANGQDDNWNVEAGWVDEVEYVRAKGTAANRNGINVFNEGRLWLRRNCVVEDAAAQGVAVYNGATVTAGGATVHFNNNTFRGVLANHNGTAEVLKASYSGNGGGATLAQNEGHVY